MLKPTRRSPQAADAHPRHHGDRQGRFTSQPGGLQAGFLSYPRDLVKSVNRVPGSGGDITAFANTTSPIPPAVDDNASWQAVNKAVNANIKLTLVPSTDYVNKTATMMAGGDLPDLFYLGNNLATANIPRFLQSAYADLTPYVSGDAVKEYPNLAAFPDLSVGPGDIRQRDLGRALHTARVQLHPLHQPDPVGLRRRCATQERGRLPPHSARAHAAAGEPLGPRLQPTPATV